MPFQTEPAYTHGQAARTAVLLCNLGTPDPPTAPALRRYLGQFLSDPRVVEIPKAVWWFILHGVILRTRPAKSAAKYASVWTPEGSPLAVWTDKQAKLLRGWLGEAGYNVLVHPAMRYGNPSIASQLDALKAAGATRILILPLYPQYSAPPRPACSTPCTPGPGASAMCPSCASSTATTTTPATSTPWRAASRRTGARTASPTSW